MPSQEANNDNLGFFFFDFLQNYCMLCVVEAILMSTLNIQFHDKIRKKILKYLFS